MTALCTTESGYRIRPDIDCHTERIIAVTPDDIVICGAYRPVELNDWRVYISKFATDALGVVQPHKVHSCSREDAVHWLDMLATLYTKAIA
ncbi:hypothetical protein [Mycobacterium colombiense]